MRDPEYDRFGPWVIEISQLDPPPSLFLPYLTKAEAPLLSVKIPRKIERRDAHPGMNLYDYVVSLYQEELIILKRVENNVRSETFFYRDIQSLCYSAHLLKGNLQLSTSTQVYDLAFNTVSSQVMYRLVEMIRQRYMNKSEPWAMTGYPEVVVDDLSFLFNRLWAREKAQQPDIRVLAAQAETPVGSYEAGFFQRLLFGIFSKRLLESLHLSDGRELKIISRGKTYKYKGHTVLGTDTFFVPLSNIVGAVWEADSKNTAVLNLILDTANNRTSFTFTRNNPSIQPYANFLAEISK